MSGGALTDYSTYPTFYMQEWAKRVELENPLLAGLLRDEMRLLDAYDYYMSGDTSEESIGKAWKEFSDRWLGNLDAVTEDVLERVLSSIKAGYRAEE